MVLFQSEMWLHLKWNYFEIISVFYFPTFAGTHCTYIQRDGRAELTWVGWLYTKLLQTSFIPVLSWPHLE